MLKIYFNKNYANNANSGGYEFQFVAHLLNPVHYNQPRFKPVLEEGSQYVTWASAEEADYHLMPYKWSATHPLNALVIEEAKRANKKLIIPFIDDNQPNIDVPNSIVLKANIDTNKKKDNEICIPIYPNTEYFDFSVAAYNENFVSVGFCGQADKPTLRKEVCELLKTNHKLNTNFIYREKFHWFYDESQLKKMRDEYTNNVSGNFFGLAIRGVGNFSYRLCEIMHMGRVPIIIRTNNELPLEEFIDWNSCAVICDETELHLLNDKIDAFVKTNNGFDIQINNRKIWKEWLSPLGFTKNFKNILEKYEQKII